MALLSPSRGSRTRRTGGGVLALPRGLWDRHRERVLSGRRPRAAGGQLARRVWVGILGDVSARCRCWSARSIIPHIVARVRGLRDAPRTAARRRRRRVGDIGPVWRRRGPLLSCAAYGLRARRFCSTNCFLSTRAAVWSGSRPASAGSWRSAAARSSSAPSRRRTSSGCRAATRRGSSCSAIF